MRRSDLIVSMLRLYWNDASNVIPELIKKVGADSSLNIDTDFIIRCMFSTSGLGTRLDFDLLRNKSNVALLQKNYEKCFKSILSTLDFVRSQCSIDSAKLVGGISTLIPFVHYIYHTPKNTVPVSSIESMRKSLFLFAFSRSLSQHMESRTRPCRHLNK